MNMQENRGLKEGLQHAWGELSKREKVLICIQVVLSVIVLALALLGAAGVISWSGLNSLDLVLLIVMFLVSALRCYPARKTSVVLNIVCAVCVAVILFTGVF